MSLDNRFLEAIECLINDIIGKYDECLVDKFLTFPLGSREMLSSVAKLIANAYESPKFASVNLGRLLKFNCAISGHKLRFGTPVVIAEEAFWKRLTQLLNEGELTTVSATLPLLNTLARSEYKFLWLTEKNFDPPIRLQVTPKRQGRISLISGAPITVSPEPAQSQTFEVKDVAQLARYFMETGQSYHVQNQAKTLFTKLVEQCNNLDENGPLAESIKQAIQEMMRNGLEPMYYSMIDILKLIKLSPHESLIDWFDVQSLVRETFEQQLTSCNENCNINLICKCQALASEPRNIDYSIQKLKATDNLEAIITYVTNLSEHHLRQSELIYILYPILAKCDSEDAQVLTPKLFITREERCYIERNLKDKHVTMCLIYLKESLTRRFHDLRLKFTIASKKMMLILEIIIEYLKCNYLKPTAAFRNTLECCCVLADVRKLLVSKSEIAWLFQLVDNLLDMIEAIDLTSSPYTKSILMALIRVLRFAQHTTTLVRIEKSDLNMIRIVKLAYKFSDHEVLDTFAELFAYNKFNFKLESEHVENYVELVWAHMYLNTIDTDHRELLGHLAYLLVEIDLEVEAPILERMNLKRHHDIPMLLGNMLMDYTSVYQTVENVVDCLSSTSVSSKLESGDGNVQTCDKTNLSYLGFLDSNTLPREVKECLDNLTKGLCRTIRSECSKRIRILALEEINLLIAEYLINSDDVHYLAKRLVDTEILETLYEVATGSMYSHSLYEKAVVKVPIIKQAIIKKLCPESPEKMTKLLVNMISRCDSNEVKGGAGQTTIDTATQERALNVANFYTRRDKFTRKQDVITSSSSNAVSLNSFIDDILNQARTSRHLECY